jgi:DNA repair protein RecN (Recombination protein N)
MLGELSIKNFAIIDDLHIEFSGGLTILSGETGAGKSIIINAMNLILGKRASADLIRTGCETAEIEACFDITPGSKTYLRMTENDLDPGDGLLIRRIISRRNRHKIYINGRTATISQLNYFTENLAGISGQHAHQGLLQEELQLLVLDQFGELTVFRDHVHTCYHRLIPLIEEHDTLTALKKRQAEQLELLDFQQKEITEADVRIGEDDDLDIEKNRLKNAEFLYQTVNDCIDTVYDHQGSVIEELSRTSASLEKASTIDPGLTEIHAGLGETVYRLEDLTASLRSYLNTVRIDPDRLEVVESRLDTLVKLKRKYGGSITAVRERLAGIETDLFSLENINREIASVKTELVGLNEQLCRAASDLSGKRKNAATALAERVECELNDLKMTDTKFRVSLTPRPMDESANPYLVCDGRLIFDTGADRAIFMISPNVGEGLKPLAAVASGGELSRIVLALKSILARSDSLETVVFDEVDAGIGGGTAEVVGKKMLGLSQYHQVICITHLPQIARFADHHFKIEKHVDKGRTRTVITPISKENRAKEIARMLGGEKITEKTLDHAAEMLDRRT